MKRIINLVEGASSIVILSIIFLKWFGAISDRFFGMMFITFLFIGAFSSLIDSIIKLLE